MSLKVSNNAFRRFATFVAANKVTRRLQLSLQRSGTCGEGKPFFSVTSRDGDLLLNVEIDIEGDSLRASQRLGGEWLAAVTLEGLGGAELIGVNVFIGERGVGLALENGATYLWDVMRANILADNLEGYGDWRFAQSASVDGYGDVNSLIRQDVPPRGLALVYKPDLIIDLGANNGDDTAFYLAKGFRVVALDANPSLCGQIVERFASEILEGRLVVLNVGLGPVRDRLSFFVNTVHNEWSSFDPEIASRGHTIEEVIVPTVTTSDIFDAYGVPYYLKIDIEGFDDLPVLAVAENPVRPQYLSFENGTLRLFECLAAAGYEQFQLVNQALVPSMECPVPAREGRSVDHRFPYGSSGPFGRDLPLDGWLLTDHMRAVLVRHHAAVAERPDNVTGQWYDLHAGRPS